MTEKEKVKKKASPARMRANKKYEDKAYDKILLRLPKGTKERIQDVSDSVNGYITKLVLSDLETREHLKALDNVPEDELYLPFS